MVDILHSNSRTIRIWTNKPVYRDSCIGNLDKTKIGEVLRCPLQYRLNSDSQTCFSVTIHNQTTRTALIQRVVSRVMPFIYCTAMRTPPASVVSVNNLKGNHVFLATRIEESSKLSKRNTVDFPVTLLGKSMFSSSHTHFFNGNGRIIGLSKIHNLFGAFSASVLDKISLLVLQFLKIFSGFSRTVISVALQFFSAFKKSALLLSYISAEVKLSFHLSGLRIKNCYGCKRGRANIDTNNEASITLWFRELLFQNSRNPVIPKKAIYCHSSNYHQENF